jgi:hypothetical protein
MLEAGKKTPLKSCDYWRNHDAWNTGKNKVLEKLVSGSATNHFAGSGHKAKTSTSEVVSKDPTWQDG